MYSISAVVTTYRRPKDLIRCLQALSQQTRLADEVVVVVRDTDTETWSMLEAIKAIPLPLQIATVTIPGAIAALNTGVGAAKGDIIAITDDDAAPHPDWLERIQGHFLSDSCIGAVGGRDWVYHNGSELENGQREIVGKVQWFGRVIGNHHLGVGTAREVDVVKGANMSFRRTAIAGRCFDQRMKGTSAQINFEIEFSLALKKAGWKIIYDPAVAVNHYPGKRFDEDKRNTFNQLAMINIVHNETLALLEHLSPIRRPIFLIWALLVGTRDAYGLIQFLRFLPQEGTLAGKKLLASLQGRWQGWRTWRQCLGQPTQAHQA